MKFLEEITNSHMTKHTIVTWQNTTIVTTAITTITTITIIIISITHTNIEHVIIFFKNKSIPIKLFKKYENL